MTGTISKFPATMEIFLAVQQMCKHWAEINYKNVLGLVFVDENGAERTDFDFDSDDADLGAALERIEQERRLSRRRKQKAKTSKADEKTTAGPGLVVVDDIGEGIIVGDPNDPNFRRPTNVNPRFFGPLPRAHEV